MCVSKSGCCSYAESRDRRDPPTMKAAPLFRAVPRVIPLPLAVLSSFGKGLRVSQGYAHAVFENKNAVNVIILIIRILIRIVS
jgi:hypothetical protein